MSNCMYLEQFNFCKTISFHVFCHWVQSPMQKYKFTQYSGRIHQMSSEEILRMILDIIGKVMRTTYSCESNESFYLHSWKVIKCNRHISKAGDDNVQNVVVKIRKWS